MAKTEKQLETYIWEGVDSEGKTASGETQGRSIALIRASLRKQGIKTKKVKKKPKPLFKLSDGGKKISPGDIAVFARQLATMMKAGVPLIQSFDIVADSLENPRMKKLLMDIQNDVASGNTLANSLAKHPKYFDDLFCNLIDAGEQSGALESLLDKVATFKEKTEALKSKLKKAFMYPSIVMSIAAIVTYILLTKVVPTFEDLFENIGGELPGLTKFVVQVSEFLQAWGLIMGVSIVGTIVSFGQARKKVPAFSQKVDAIILKLPVMGDITYKGIIARFARTLETTFAAGVPLVEALDSVAGASGNYVFYKVIKTVQEDVSSGTPLFVSMQQSGVFPNMAIQMTSIGEESGSLDAMLGKVADYYENEVDDLVENLSKIIEPMIMAFIAVVVGGLLVAMYMPIFKLGDTL